MRLKGLSQSGRWPSGNPRYYLRRAGEKAIPMPDAPKGSKAFLAAYTAATGDLPKGPERPAAGTVGALLTGYKASAAYQNLAASTRAYIGRNLDDIRRTWGRAPAADLQTRHILGDLARFQPHPANNRLRAWKAACKWAFQEGALIDHDPAAPIRKRAVPKSDGFTPWDADDVGKFRAHWPHDTPQRLAFELIHRTGAAVVDACAMSPGMIRDGWLIHTRRKSGSRAVCPMTAETSPAWFGHDDNLAECLAAQPRHMSYIVTTSGASRSEKATSQWFAAACRAAGVKGKTAHGLRKYRAAMFQERGASADQRMAILGHETESEARRYSGSADLRRTVSGTQTSNSHDSALADIAQVVEK